LFAYGGLFKNSRKDQNAGNEVEKAVDYLKINKEPRKAQNAR
jgi:hypothetical protein